MSRKIHIFDTTLRDGEQSPGCSMNLAEKVKMAKQLEKLGVDIIEAGFPIASEGEFQAVQAVSKTLKHATVAALCRAKIKDIDRAWEAIKDAASPRIHTFIATSEIHMKHKLGMSRREVLADLVEAVSHARKYTDNVEFSAEDASRSDLDFLIEASRAAIAAGATVVNLPDTVGYATPTDYGNIFAAVRKQIPESHKIQLSAHCHNDLGLAVANSLAAIENGAEQVECTINGIGERAGNASLEEIVMALFVRSEAYECQTDIHSRQLFPTSQLLSAVTGVQVQPHKAIVGDNAFAHEAGIHQDGVLKNALTYEIMTPESVGVNGNNIVLGKHSGRHALRARYRDFGFEFDGNELDEIYREFLKVADRKKSVGKAELLAIAEKREQQEPAA